MALIKTFGDIPENSAIVVGAWDPLFPEVEKGLRRLSRACTRSGKFDLLPILIDPPPPATLYPANHPRFECAEAKISRILNCGARGVIKLSLSKKDLEKGIEFLLDNIGKHTGVKCIFLGKYQSLGSAGRGDPRTIRRVCEKRGVEVMPSKISVLMNKRSAYRLYKRNAFVQIEKLLGRPLSWMGHMDKLQVPLKAGIYRAKIARSNANLVSPEARYCDLNVDFNGDVAISRACNLRFAGQIWVAPTKLLRRAK